MAITINQQPTSPNMANNTLVFSVNSGYVAQPQFQYVCDIKDASNNLIQRIKQQPNPTGYGVFDIGQILTNNVGPADPYWKIQSAQENAGRGCGKDFKVYFGEEYGTSVSSSVVLYNGVTNATGSLPPAKSGSGYYFTLDGLVNPNDKVNWNWNSGSKYNNRLIDDATFNVQYGLTDFPATQSIRSTEYQTIAFLNGNLNGTSSSLNAQDIWAMYVTEYDVTGSLLQTTIYYNDSNNGNGGPRTDFTQIWADVYTSQNQDTRLIHFPVGPQNFLDAGNGLEPNTAYYVCTFYEQATDGGRNDNGIYGTYRFDLTTADCGYEGTRLAWKNKYGVWDYYTFPLAESTISNIERSTYTQTFVNFSSTSSTVSYDKSRRGATQFINKVSKQRTAESDWLNQEYADLLTELFYSTDVYIQDGTDMLPIVVTNATITEKTNPRTQKTFKYTLEYKLANDEQNRL